MTIRVILANDHRILLEAVSSFIGSEPDMEIVGMDAAGDAVQELSAALSPDVVVMGVGAHRSDSLDAIRRLTTAYPGIKVVALASFAQQAGARRVIEAGASACVSKNNPSRELIHALHAVMAGQEYLHTNIADAPACVSGPSH